jgi:hypothetical protein
MSNVNKMSDASEQLTVHSFRGGNKTCNVQHQAVSNLKPAIVGIACYAQGSSDILS